MLKLIGIAQREPDTPVGDVIRYWREVHAQIAGRSPEVRGCVVSEVLRGVVGDIHADAFIELWWDENTDPAAVADHAHTMSNAWFGREHVLRRRSYPEAGLLRGGSGDDPARVKLLGTANRREDFTKEAFFDYWRDVHAPVGAKAPDLGAWVVTETVSRAAGELDLDALVELWWDDDAALTASMASPEIATAWEDVARYARTDGTFWVCREHVLIAPPASDRGLVDD